MAIQVRAEPGRVGPGEIISVSLAGSSSGEAVAYPVQMQDWRLPLRREGEVLMGRRRLPAWVSPGSYTWRVEVDGEVVGEATAEVVWPPKALARAAAWAEERGRLARAEADRWDEHWAGQAVPAFPYVGVWFSGDFYHRYGAPQGSPTIGHPYARPDDLGELRYLHEELGVNMMVCSGVGEEAQRYAAEHLAVLAGPGGGYRFHDEPDAGQEPVAEVDAWVQATLAAGQTPIVNFCGHSEGDWWDGYARDYLQQYRLPVVSVDCYPVFYDFPNMGYFAKRVAQVGEWARAAGSRYLVIAQGFACLGKWAFPTAGQVLEMARASHDAGAEGILFFLWTSGWKGPHDEYLIGLDSAPVAYHRLLRALRGR